MNTTQKMTGSSQLRVVIVGAGIGGAAVALALQQQGIHAEIYEQASALHEVGAAIMMKPPSIKLFQLWGIGDSIESLSTRIYWKMDHSADGTILERQALPEATDDPNQKWVDAIHRADLHNTLLEQLPAASLHLNHKCTMVDDRMDEAEVHFADGSSVKADLVIAADGIHSVIRPLIRTDTPIYSGYHACRALIPGEKSLDLVPDNTMSLWHGDKAKVMMVPIRAGLQIYINVIIYMDDYQGESWTTTIKKDDLMKKLQGFEPKILQAIRTIDGPIGDRAVFDRAPLDKWSLQHVTLVGDAAHPMLPTQGQGANMAIQDAGVLAELLRNVGTSHLQQALQQYEEQRIPITALFQHQSRQSTWSPGNG